MRESATDNPTNYQLHASKPNNNALTTPPLIPPRSRAGSSVNVFSSFIGAADMSTHPLAPMYTRPWKPDLDTSSISLPAITFQTSRLGLVNLSLQ